MATNNHAWLLFLPQPPTSPSNLRVLVWRRLRNAGATALQNGVWVLSHTPQNERLMGELSKEIESQGGNSFLLTASPLDSKQNEEIIERFRKDRDQEYSEFGDRCGEFLAEIDKETTSQKFSFAELEENEDDLHKLTGWLRKIQARDFFKGHQALPAAEKLAACQEALKKFAEAVYTAEGLGSVGNGSVEEQGGLDSEEGRQPG